MSAVEQVVGVAGEQFYVTHCTPSDSVLNDPGYAVRAASVADPDALGIAFRYPPYELPIDLWKDRPAVADTPRRLARTAHPRGGVWVVHSVYVAKDTVDRDRSYFSHLLHLPAPAASLIAVLESWDAGGWAKEYPAGAPKTLPRAGPLPIGRTISRLLLGAFLSRPKTGASDLASVVCPARLHADVSARRDIAARFLQALVLVTEAKRSGSTRDRLFVHAEPGLVAMLLYAAAHILPPHFTADLTFSTFEPAHRALRAYHSATVVGTFTGTPGRGLDPDLATACGYTFDTVEPERSSPELSGWVGVPAGIPELIDLAADGKWELLGKVHRKIGTGAAAFARVVTTIDRFRAAPEVKAAGPKSPTATISAARQTTETAPALLGASVPPAPAAPIQPINPLAGPRSPAPWVRLWADKRVRVGVIVGGVLLLAVAALVTRSPKRGAVAVNIETAAAPVTPAMPPANPPITKGTEAKPASPNPVHAGPKPADASGPGKPLDPLPPVGELPPPEAANPVALAETVGLLAGLQLYQTYLNIGLLADARAEGLYEAGEVAQLLGSVVAPLERVEKQLDKVAALKSLTDDDRAAVARMRKIAGLLREQGTSLQLFWDTGVADQGKKYEEARQAAWKELSDLLQLDPKKAPPDPDEKP